MTALFTLNLHQRGDGCAGAVISFVVVSDFNNATNIPDCGYNAYRTIALTLPNTRYPLADELLLGFVEVHGLASFDFSHTATSLSKSTLSLYAMKSPLYAMKSPASSSRWMRIIRSAAVFANSSD